MCTDRLCRGSHKLRFANSLQYLRHNMMSLSLLLASLARRHPYQHKVLHLQHIQLSRHICSCHQYWRTLHSHYNWPYQHRTHSHLEQICYCLGVLYTTGKSIIVYTKFYYECIYLTDTCLQMLMSVPEQMVPSPL